MAFQEAARTLALYLGLLTFAVVAGLSYQHGVELLFCVLRGIGGCFAVVLLQRSLSGMLGSVFGEQSPAGPAEGEGEAGLHTNS